MCDNCRDWDEKLYPDLGEGAFLTVDPETITTAMNEDPAYGVRISQERDVSYVGPEGAVTRHEIQSVWIPWNIIEDAATGLIGMDLKHKRTCNNEHD